MAFELSTLMGIYYKKFNMTMDIYVTVEFNIWYLSE